MNIQNTKANCLRCGYEWTPRKHPIAECPRCKRYDWAVRKLTDNLVRLDRLAFPDSVTEEDKSKYFGRHFDVAEEVKDANKH